MTAISKCPRNIHQAGLTSLTIDNVLNIWPQFYLLSYFSDLTINVIMEINTDVVSAKENSPEKAI